jgi:hypothetical protein
MAVVEIQFQQKVFFDIIAAQIVRTEPPAVLLSQLPPGALIERTETGTIELASGEEVLFADDELAVKVPVSVHVTNYDGAKTAGSLQPPVTIAQGCTIWLRLQGAARVRQAATRPRRRAA